MTDCVVRVDCGNCGDRFWLLEPLGVGGLARDLHEHWSTRHNGTGIHPPTVTVYRPVTS